MISNENIFRKKNTQYYTTEYICVMGASKNNTVLKQQRTERRVVL